MNQHTVAKWEALDRQDYEWSDYIDSCLERDGLERIAREDCQEAILDLSPLERNQMIKS